MTAATSIVLLWIVAAVTGLVIQGRLSLRGTIILVLLIGSLVIALPKYTACWAVLSVVAWLSVPIVGWVRAPRHHHTTPQHTGHVYRPDIDGLRAFAIVPVVIFHAFPTLMPSGFIGVDIFFVISGFLITQIIIEQHQNGRFTYLDFYTRRARRIFPALSLVIVSVMVTGWFVLFRDEYQTLNEHVMAGVLFVSNLLSYRNVDYFAPAVYQVPLIHLWSLGVEEQFYLVWPIVIGVCIRKPRLLLACFGVILLASFFTTQYLQGPNAAAAFYWPVSRFWELAIGGIAAWLVSYRLVGREDAASRQLYTAASVVGFVLLLTAFVSITEDTPFPGVAALLPTLGAFLIIVSGPETWVARRIMADRGFVAIGVISYPLYLWHWPVLSFAQIYYEPLFTPVWKLVGLVVSVLLAVLTYHLLERRVRTRVNGRPIIATRTIVVTMMGTALLAAGLWVVKPATALSPYDGANKQKTAENEEARPQSVQLCRDSGFTSPFRGRCVRKAAQDDSASDYVVIGDSLSIAFASALLNTNQPHAVTLMGRHGCIPFPGMERYGDAQPFNCDKPGAIQGMFKAVKEMPVPRDRVIFVVGRFSHIEGRKLNPNNRITIRMKYRDRAVPLTDAERERDYTDAATELFQVLTTLPRTKVVFVYQFPEFSYAPDNCIRRGVNEGTGWGCPMSRAVEDTFFARYRRIIDQVLTRFPQVETLDPMNTFCDATSCYAAYDGHMLYKDDTHPNLSGAQLLLPEILRRFP